MLPHTTLYEELLVASTRGAVRKVLSRSLESIGCDAGPGPLSPFVLRARNRKTYAVPEASPAACTSPLFVDPILTIRQFATRCSAKAISSTKPSSAAQPARNATARMCTSSHFGESLGSSAVAGGKGIADTGRVVAVTGVLHTPRPISFFAETVN